MTCAWIVINRISGPGKIKSRMWIRLEPRVVRQIRALQALGINVGPVGFSFFAAAAQLPLQFWTLMHVRLCTLQMDGDKVL
jgi:hypothetical protein